MGVYHAMKKIADVLDLDTLYGFPKITGFGVPPEARTGAHPRMYLDTPTLSFDSESLQGAYNTDTRANAALYLIVSDRDPKFVALNKTMDEFLLEIIPQKIMDLVQAATINRTFQQDGSKGSRVVITNIDYDYRPDDPIAAMRITFEISQFQ